MSLTAKLIMRSALSALLIFFYTGPLFAQGGFLFENKTVESKILNEDRKYAIYLPADYNTSDRNYPILYLMHPAGPRGTVPNQQSWFNYGELKQYLDKAIEHGEIAPMIVVSPDANFGSKRISYYNDPEGDFNFEDFFFKEFMPHIEKAYRCRTEKGSRAIAGASMGGGATLYYALHHPELFAASCPLSAAVRGFDINNLRNRYADVDEAKLKKWYAPYNVYDLFKLVSTEDAKSIAWYIACGDDDALSKNNSLLHIQLKESEIPHEFRISDGKHDWEYWRSITADVFEFVSAKFKK